MKLVFNNKMKI